MKRFILTCALMTLSIPAYGDTKSFDTFISTNTDYKNTLDLATKRVANITYPKCPSEARITKRAQTILTPIKMPPKEEEPKDTAQEKNTQTPKNIFPLYGQWIERVLTQTCDTPTVINHLAVAYGEQQPILLPLLNGKTRLDVIEQPIAEIAIAERLKKQSKPCDSKAFIINTNAIGYRTKDNKGITKKDQGNGWFEQWTLRACETNYDANIAILPDPKSKHQYIVRLKETQ